MRLNHLHLRPPLGLLWAAEDSFAAVRVSDRDVAFIPLSRKREGLAAVAPDGEILWTRPAKGPGVCNAQPLPGGKYLTAEGAPKFDTLSVLDADTGAVVWTGEHREIVAVRSDGCECEAIEWMISRGRARVLGMTLPPECRVRWERAFQVRGRPRTHVAVRPGPGTEESLFLFDDTDPDKPALLAVDPCTGQERWRSEGPALATAPRADGDWRAALAEGNRLIYRTEEGLACLDARTGQGLWKAATVRESTVYRDVIVATHERTVWMLSSETGRLRRKKDLTKALSTRHPGNQLTIGCAISETHVFVCDELGTLWALDRETLEPTWSHCPAGTVGGLNSPQIIRGRLYANTVSWERGVPNHLYCWGPAKEGEPPGPSDLDAIDTEGDLPFAIVEVLPRRQLAKRPPFQEAGGPFTVYRCRLEESGAEFFFADRVAGGAGLLRGAAAALWAAGVEEGEALLRAFQTAMPLKKRRVKRVGRGVGLKAPAHFRGVDLHGPGVRQRRKWNSPDNEAELIVEWDMKAMRGMIRETDELFREGVLALIAGLVSRR
jgi:outer membrane protein assembly factor BamB